MGSVLLRSLRRFQYFATRRCPGCSDPPPSTPIGLLWTRTTRSSDKARLCRANAGYRRQAGIGGAGRPERDPGRRAERCSINSSSSARCTGECRRPHPTGEGPTRAKGRSPVGATRGARLSAHRWPHGHTLARSDRGPPPNKAAVPRSPARGLLLRPPPKIPPKKQATSFPPRQHGDGCSDNMGPQPHIARASPHCCFGSGLQARKFRRDSGAARPLAPPMCPNRTAAEPS